MLRAIIVEDELMIRRGLEKHVHWTEIGISEVRSAACAEEALKICTTFIPDVIVSDIRMPGENGISLCKKLRERFPECEIIFISGYDDKEYLKAAIALRSVSYIEKPVRIQEIEAILQRVVDQHRKAEQKNAAYEEMVKRKRDEEAIIFRQDLDKAEDSEQENSFVVRQVKDYICQHYEDSKLSLTELADFVGLSVVYLSSCFKKCTGVTISEYLTKVRMERAKSLLKAPEWKHYEVAYKVGYEDPKYFARIFKRYTGKTPSEYRKGIKTNEKET